MTARYHKAHAYLVQFNKVRRVSPLCVLCYMIGL